MKIGSLFDGIGGFPLSAVMCGAEPVWASEIEPFPILTTYKRFPSMKHLGSVTEINGAEIEPVDIITFGSPCQDLSVAGKQAGIHDGERSNLFFEAVRIIKEMRAKDAAAGRTDEHCRPRFAVWENVPGAFSSNKGADFQAVLQALAEVRTTDVSIPMPPKGKWSKAGCIVGDGWGIAWRVYDAQYWGITIRDRDTGHVRQAGTPQRRKRIYLVADFASERAGEILFERESVCGNPAQSGETREGTATDAQGSAGGSFGASVGAFMGGQGAKAKGIGWSETIAPTIKSVMSGSNTIPDVVYSLHDKATRHKGGGETRKNDGAANGLGIQADGKMFTLDTSCRHGICYRCLNDGAFKADGTACTLRSRIPRDRADIVIYDTTQITSPQNRSNPKPNDPSHPLAAQQHPPLMVYPMVTGALCANSHPGSYTGQDAFNDMLPVIKADKPPRKYIVRRLTPLECCRLQGFPDGWTENLSIPDPTDEELSFFTKVWADWSAINGTKPKTAAWVRKWLADPQNDSAEYKAYGNSLAIPCAYDVIRRVVDFCDREKSEAGH